VLKKLLGENQLVKDKNKQTENNCGVWKYPAALDKILGGRPATKPLAIIDTLDSSTDTGGIIDDDDQEVNSVGKGTNESICCWH